MHTHAYTYIHFHTHKYTHNLIGNVAPSGSDHPSCYMTLMLCLLISCFTEFIMIIVIRQDREDKPITTLKVTYKAIHYLLITSH